MPTVAIIGGGFSGTAIAYHLTRASRAGAVRIVVVEPRSALGGGLAYSSDDPAHRVNVPASRMSIDPDEPQHFEAWLAADGALAADPEAVIADGRAFPHRAVFGRYMREQIAPALASGRVVHRRARLLRLRRGVGRFHLVLSTGEGETADLVVIATSHPPPMPPRIVLSELAGNSRLIADPTRSEALEGVLPDDRVFIVGSGLTMADIVASLDKRGHRGAIVAVSRRGQLSRGHPERLYPQYGNFSQPPLRTCGDLVRAIRSTLADANAQNIPWQPVFDRLRTQGRDIWAALDLEERRRLVRHLRPFWDAHRFRVAPQVEAVIERRKREGRFELVAGTIVAIKRGRDAINVWIRSRGNRGMIVRTVERIAVATGPAHREILSTEPFLARLEADGLVRLDSVGLGLDVDRRGRAIGGDSDAAETLLIGGPLARGTFGELMGLPEVACYALDIAREITEWLAQRQMAAVRLAG